MFIAFFRIKKKRTKSGVLNRYPESSAQPLLAVRSKKTSAFPQDRWPVKQPSAAGQFIYFVCRTSKCPKYLRKTPRDRGRMASPVIPNQSSSRVRDISDFINLSDIATYSVWESNFATSLYASN